MKKTLSLLAVSFFICSASHAVDSTGCGLGSTIFRGESGPVMQILAVTTNATFGTQTFGITSGTSGCDPNGRITGGTGKILVFLENNIDTFAFDAAKGKGETINVIASIANVDADKAGEIIRNNFDTLFIDENVDVVALSLQISELLGIA